MDNNVEWYYTDRNGEQAGPVSTAELHIFARKGLVSERSLVWHEGMDNWSLASEVENALPDSALMVPPPPANSPAPPSSTGTNPYATPQTNVEHDLGAHSHPPCGGIGRLYYFILSIVLPAIFVIVISAAGSSPALAPTPGILMLGFFAVSVALVALRYKNIGYNPWWGLLILVPIVSIVVSIRCLIYQEGWAYTRKLDATGRVISWIIAGLFFLYLVLAITGFALGH